MCSLMFCFLVLGVSGSKDSSAKVSRFNNVSSREGEILRIDLDFVCKYRAFHNVLRDYKNLL